MVQLRVLEDLDVENKVVLCRVDLNVPMSHGRVEDMTRIRRVVPTIEALIQRRAKVVVMSHFGRPQGQFNLNLSLASITDALSKALGNKDVKFAVDCVGESVRHAVSQMQPGDVLLLENLRFHPGEKNNDPEFVRALASLGEVYVNDAFSCAHRSHASIVGLAAMLPSAAGLLMQEELSILEGLLAQPEPPMAAIIGGAKVSTKLDLLQSLMQKVQLLVIGGAMANTFLAAKGVAIGQSLYEKNLVKTARVILQEAEKNGCEVLLPEDAIIARELKEKVSTQVVSVAHVPADAMILDLGPVSIARIAKRLAFCKVVVWNGPLGAFETRPFDVGTISLARSVAYLTAEGNIKSIAGGGDVVAALGVSGLTHAFTYISTAGGAFLEWLEGKELPGVKMLLSIG